MNCLLPHLGTKTWTVIGMERSIDAVVTSINENDKKHLHIFLEIHEVLVEARRVSMETDVCHEEHQISRNQCEDKHCENKHCK